MKTKFQELKDFRNRIGKLHFFHSVNKIMKKIDSMDTSKIYISKEFLKEMSLNLFGDEMRLIDFLFSSNEYVRLSLVQEISEDLNVDITAEIKKSFESNKLKNSSLFPSAKAILNSDLHEDFTSLSKEEKEVLDDYLSNIANLKQKLCYLNPMLDSEINYFHRVIKKYVEFLDKNKEIYDFAK